MAGDWIKMRCNLWDDPRVARLCDLTDSSESTVIGGLYWLWATADQHSEDGVMTGLTLRSIDRKTGIKGFGEALISIGWLIDEGDSVQLARFEEHNGASAKTRLQTAKRVANHKNNSQVTQGALPIDETANASTVSDALPRIREEKSKDKTPLSPRSGDSFENFWAAWPKSDRKTAKTKCAERWVKAKLYDIADQIIDHVQASKTQNDQWKRGYEPAPLTYLNQERWTDGQQINSPELQEWWQKAGFEKEWQAVNEGCNEFNTRFYRNGVRIDGQVSHS